MVKRGGFTLVEVMVALVVLEAGLLGVVGTLVLAARTLTRAELEEAGAAEVERVLDSLVTAGTTSGQGTVPSRTGAVRWTSTSGGGLRLVFSAPIDTALVVVETGPTGVAGSGPR
jgi:type II secretory pathway pseudopilin PulG